MGINCVWSLAVQPHPPQEPIFFVDEYPHSSNRTRRSLMGDIHQNRYVETLVVVDPPMVKNHTSEKVATYVLSVLNIVSLYTQVK